MTDLQNPFGTEPAPRRPHETDHGPGESFTRHKGLVEVLATSEGARDDKAPRRAEGYGG